MWMPSTNAWFACTENGSNALSSSMMYLPQESRGTESFLLSEMVCERFVNDTHGMQVM
jgi:hypothetical protein